MAPDSFSSSITCKYSVSATQKTICTSLQVLICGVGTGWVLELELELELVLLPALVTEVLALI